MDIIKEQQDKQAFFAQHWDQEIVAMPHFSKPQTPMCALYYWDEEDSLVAKESHLELTPLSNITDEDAIEVARIFQYEKEFNAKEATREWLSSILYNKREYFSSPHHHYITAIDYLRSRGYLVPYLNYTIEDLIEKGWVKVKK